MPPRVKTSVPPYLRHRPHTQFERIHRDQTCQQCSPYTQLLQFQHTRRLCNRCSPRLLSHAHCTVLSCIPHRPMLRLPETNLPTRHSRSEIQGSNHCSPRLQLRPHCTAQPCKSRMPMLRAPETNPPPPRHSWSEIQWSNHCTVLLCQSLYSWFGMPLPKCAVAAGPVLRPRARGGGAAASSEMSWRRRWPRWRHPRAPAWPLKFNSILCVVFF